MDVGSVAILKCRYQSRVHSLSPSLPLFHFLSIRLSFTEFHPSFSELDSFSRSIYTILLYNLLVACRIFRSDTKTLKFLGQYLSLLDIF